MKKQYIYRVCLKHDEGRFTVDVNASSAKLAKTIVCDAENAPLRAATHATRMRRIA